MTTLRPVVVSDFDGTVAHLPVDWAQLRRELGVERIELLWDSADADAWAPVTRAEVAAAAQAKPIEPTVRALAGARAVAVLTSNSEHAVRAFLDRFPALDAHVGLVVGRETLAGRKTDFEIFRAGFERALAAIAPDATAGDVSFLGDQEYELAFARRLGADAHHVDALTPAS